MRVHTVLRAGWIKKAIPNPCGVNTAPIHLIGFSVNIFPSVFVIKLYNAPLNDATTIPYRYSPVKAITEYIIQCSFILYTKCRTFSLYSVFISFISFFILLNTHRPLYAQSLLSGIIPNIICLAHQKAIYQHMAVYLEYPNQMKFTVVRHNTMTDMFPQLRNI